MALTLSHVVEEVFDVGKEVVIEEVIVNVCGIRDEEISSCAERSQKNLSPFSHTGLEVVGFERPIVPICGASCKPG